MAQYVNFLIQDSTAYSLVIIHEIKQTFTTNYSAKKKKKNSGTFSAFELKFHDKFIPKIVEC